MTTMPKTKEDTEREETVANTAALYGLTIRDVHVERVNNKLVYSWTYKKQKVETDVKSWRAKLYSNAENNKVDKIPQWTSGLNWLGNVRDTLDEFLITLVHLFTKTWTDEELEIVKKLPEGKLPKKMVHKTKASVFRCVSELEKKIHNYGKSSYVFVMARGPKSRLDVVKILYREATAFEKTPLKENGVEEVTVEDVVEDVVEKTPVSSPKKRARDETPKSGVKEKAASTKKDTASKQRASAQKTRVLETSPVDDDDEQATHLNITKEYGFCRARLANASLQTTEELMNMMSMHEEYFDDVEFVEYLKLVSPEGWSSPDIQENESSGKTISNLCLATYLERRAKLLSMIGGQLYVPIE
ncbi:MAG: hypothetical protein ACO35C_03935 [Pontimonas sp.]